MIRTLIHRYGSELIGNIDRQILLGWMVAAALMSSLGWAVLSFPIMTQIVVLVSILMLMMFFTRPEFSLLVFFALRAVFDLLWWIPGTIVSLNMMELFTGAVTGMAAILFILEFKKVDWHPCLKPFVPFVGVLFVAMLRNLELRAAAEILARYISPLLIMFLVSIYFSTREKRKRMFVVATAVGILPVTLAIYQLMAGQMSTYLLAGYFRLLGPYKNLHNHALMEMFIASMVIFWFFQVKSERLKLGLAIYGSAAILCLYLTYVRTALLGLVIFMVIFLKMTNRKNLLWLGAIGLVLFVMANPIMQDRFKDMIILFMPDEQELARRKLGSGRWGLWSSSLREYFRYPLGDILLGLGLGKHWLLTREYFNPYSVAQHGYVDPHSDYLTMTYQVGPIASFSYIAMQMQTFYYSYRVSRLSKDPWSRNFAIFLFALGATAMFADTISNAFINRTTLGWYFWGLAGLMYAEHRQTMRELHEEENLKQVATPAAPAAT